MRTVSISVAVIMLLLGAVWFLQGINILPGSFMTGQPMWTIIGGALIIVGGLILFNTFRNKPNTPNL